MISRCRPLRPSLRKIVCCGLSLVFLAAQSPAQDNPAQSPAESGTTSTPPARTTNKLDKQAEAALKTAAAQGFPLTTETVAEKVSVEAVLLPPKICKRVFGNEIAQNFAAVELTISNRSSQGALILHSVFIDYSQWALSGSMYLQPAPTADNKNTTDKDSKDTTSKKKGKDKKGGYPVPGSPESYQASTNPNQISSVEYRVARGDLLDAQPWTTRNWIMRALVLAGSIATAYAFSISEQGIIRGIAAFSGQVVPAAETFWPDGTVGQMNRISDVGFQVNKVIPKDSSDIVVAFFPLDRFLTPGLRKLYLESPALFFAPYALVVDAEARKALTPIVASFMPRPAEPPKLTPKEWNKQSLQKADAFLTELARQYMLDVVTRTDETGDKAGDATGAKQTPCKDVQEPADPKPYPLTAKETCVVTRFLAHASLNTIHIKIDGDMTVNADQVPASIISIDMDDGNDNAAVWTTVGDVKGVISGSRLTGGVVTVAEAQKLGIGTITTDDNSTDTQLHFTLPLTAAIPAGQTLTFKVTKKDKQNNPVDSGNYIFTVQYSSPGITDASLSGTKLTLSGSGFPTTKPSPLKVLLFAPDASAEVPTFTVGDTSVVVNGTGEVDVDLSTAVDLSTKTNVKLDPPGCWTAKAKNGADDVAGSAQFAKPPSSTPTVTCAGKNDTNIEVVGTDLLDLRGCGRKPPVFKFTLIDKAKKTQIKSPKFLSNTRVSFSNPNPSADWQVQVQFNGAPIGSPLTVQATSCPAN